MQEFGEFGMWNVIAARLDFDGLETYNLGAFTFCESET